MIARHRLFLLVAALAAALTVPVGAETPQVLIIAHPDAPVQQIDRQQATQIFLKQTQSWPDGKPVTPVDLKEGSSVRGEFYGQVLGRNPGQLRAYWARQMFTGMAVPPRELPGPAEVTKFIASTPGTVGYVPPQNVAPSVKVILDPRN